MIDVGQGDAIALRTPHGALDSVRCRAARGAAATPGARRSFRTSGAAAGSSTLFVLSHPHTDHVGGAASVLRALAPGDVRRRRIPRWRGRLSRVARRGARRRRSLGARPSRRQPRHRRRVASRFSRPIPRGRRRSPIRTSRASSRCVRVGDVRMLFVGDAERAEEEWLLAHDSAALRADILKVGHHGSKTSSTAAISRPQCSRGSRSCRWARATVIIFPRRR